MGDPKYSIKLMLKLTSTNYWKLPQAAKVWS
jgi:hypothetical protein